MQPQANLSAGVTLDAASVQNILAKTGLAATLEQARQIAGDIQGRSCSPKTNDGPMDLPLLLHMAPFARFTVQQLAFAGEYTAQALQILLEENPFVIMDIKNKNYRLHPVLRDILLLKLEGADPALRRHCYRRAGLWYARQNQTIEALEMFWPVQDYEAILSLRLTGLIAAKIGGEPIHRVAALILRDCPEDVQRRYPLSLLRLAYLLAAASQTQAFEEHMPKIRQRIGEEYAADWYFILSISRAFRLDAMLPPMEKAFQLAKGRPVQVLDATEPFLFGFAGAFSSLHHKPGKAREEGAQLERYVELYSALTGGGGQGADVFYWGEMENHSGNLSRAVALLSEAAFIAKAHRQSMVYLGCAHNLAEIAIHRADVDGFTKALAMMDESLTFSAQSAPCAQKIYDLCRTNLYLVLEKPQNAASWLFCEEISSFHLMLRCWISYLQTRVLYATDSAENALGFALGAWKTYRHTQIILPTLTCLFACLSAYYRAEEKQEEQVYDWITQVMPALDADGLDLLIGTFYRTLQPLLDRYYKETGVHSRKHLQKIGQSYFNGQTLLKKLFFNRETLPKNLTKRERTVAELAAQGLRNKEIAEKLHISAETVRTHLANIYKKLEIDRRSQISDKL